MTDWTDADIELLKKVFEQVSMPNLLKLFPDRNKLCIFSKGKELGMTRACFKTSNNGYSMLYALCPKHGIMLKTEVYWKNNLPCCPKCGRRVRWTPRSSKYKVRV